MEEHAITQICLSNNKLTEIVAIFQQTKNYLPQFSRNPMTSNNLTYYLKSFVVKKQLTKVHMESLHKDTVRVTWINMPFPTVKAQKNTCEG